MLTKSGHTETCGHCNQSRYVGEDKYSCDQCGAEVSGHFQMTVFFNDKDAEKTHFCNWRCLLAKLPAVECDSFIDLPYLQFDEADAGQGAADFFEAMGRADAKQRTN